MYSELHYALAFSFFSMLAALKYDVRSEEHSYLYKAYREHLRNKKKFK